MTVQLLTVTEDEGEQRLDKWLRRRFPQLNQVAVEKLCRTGQIRVDSGRVKASDRVAPGQTVRVPPLPARPRGLRHAFRVCRRRMPR
jgi:23S rRNA pseudouridine955/2504/2580 synthase